MASLPGPYNSGHNPFLTMDIDITGLSITTGGGYWSGEVSPGEYLEVTNPGVLTLCGPNTWDGRGSPTRLGVRMNVQLRKVQPEGVSMLPRAMCESLTAGVDPAGPGEISLNPLPGRKYQHWTLRYQHERKRHVSA